MNYFNWLCCRVWVHVHCFFQRPYPLDNDIIFPVALPFAKKKRKIEKIACVAGVERWRELGGREIGRGLGLFPCSSLSPPPPSPPLPFLRLPRRLRKKWIDCLLEHRKKLNNNPRNYATAKQFLWRKLSVQQISCRETTPKKRTLCSAWDYSQEKIQIFSLTFCLNLKRSGRSTNGNRLNGLTIA